jgi:hypothetical protein
MGAPVLKAKFPAPTLGRPAITAGGDGLVRPTLADGRRDVNFLKCQINQRITTKLHIRQDRFFLTPLSFFLSGYICNDYDGPFSHDLLAKIPGKNPSDCELTSLHG